MEGGKPGITVSQAVDPASGIGGVVGVDINQLRTVRDSAVDKPSMERNHRPANLTKGCPALAMVSATPHRYAAVSAVSYATKYRYRMYSVTMLATSSAVTTITVVRAVMSTGPRTTAAMMPTVITRSHRMILLAR